ncbi:hypothetical protein [Mucilaginibacter psychrotolerans]|uniref:DUF4468 domain-containing protein n=1 Tax=Mucilaginibacter psychrotolerans TaxID=1524096 RepID=A0A4Y8SC58_9SPHI|nr:hypothetical protein [Mucilaginibacter psychrotolerans]TFF36205.1 hypothetical protein E2R66_16830 [Mucilaginibacter psychrotolerans]
MRKLILIVIVSLILNKSFAQDFYADYVNYLDAHTKSNKSVTKSQYHSLHKRSARELKNLFKTVQQKTSFDMLKSDTLFILEITTDFYNGGYSILVWNNMHSCFYEIPYSSPRKKYKNAPINIKVNAKVDLDSLDVGLKKIVETVDTVAYRQFFRSKEPNITGQIVKFTTAKRVKNRWIFFTSKSIMLMTPE